MFQKLYEKPEIKIHEFEISDSIAVPPPTKPNVSITVRNIDAFDETDE